MLKTLALLWLLLTLVACRSPDTKQDLFKNSSQELLREEKVAFNSYKEVSDSKHFLFGDVHV